MTEESISKPVDRLLRQFKMPTPHSVPGRTFLTFNFEQKRKVIKDDENPYS